MKKMIYIFFLVLICTSLQCSRSRTNTEQTPVLPRDLPPEITIDEILDCQAQCDQVCLEWNDLNQGKLMFIDLDCGYGDRVLATCKCSAEPLLEDKI